MYCYTRSAEKRVLLIPSTHNEKEKDLLEVLPQIFEECDNIKIYWESLIRYEKNDGTLDPKKSGIEDSKLLALFELILFVIVEKDSRLREDIYEGIGSVEPDDDKYDGVNISQKASNAARGSQAIINLRAWYSDILDGRYVDPDIEDYLTMFNLEELIDNRNNDDYLDKYTYNLLTLYDILLDNLERDGDYYFIDFKFIKGTLNKIHPNTPFFDSRFYATDLKEYAKLIRDISNAMYISSDINKYNISNAICCIGSAHLDTLREYIIKEGIKVNIVKVLNKLDDVTFESVKELLREYFEDL